MADPYPDSGGFPDTHTTTTTTTATHHTTTSGQFTIDKQYAFSVPGILRIVEIIIGFLYWTVVASYYYAFSGYGWIIFTAVTSWVFTLVLFILFLFALTQRVTIINWVLTELINNAAWCLFHFIGAILISVRSGQYKYYIEHGKLVFGALCGWALFVLYGLSMFFNIRQFQASGGFNSIRMGGPATTTTTTTTVSSSSATVITASGGDGEKGQSPPPYPGGPFT